MSEKRANLEDIAPTVEEAVAKGLADLGLPMDAVEVEVLDQGSRGLFGLGTRQARIRLAVKNSPGGAKGKEAVPVVETPTVVETVEAPSQGAVVEEAVPTMEEMLSEEEEQDLRVARETVVELLEKMHVRAEVTSHYGERDEDRNRTPILVDITGDDLSILIGRRAETLNALQYIAGLIVGKELGGPVSLIIDVEGYRARREGQLRHLARRMAEQAVKTGRRQVLEPMPASERRIIHIELRENPEVTTESVGEEPRRKVTILPKEH